MKTRLGIGLLVVWCWLTVAAGAEELEPRTWTVDGVTREALIHVPKNLPAGGAPVVFAFHGHGGSMRQASRSFPIHQLWPEAIVVYPQGLPTPGQLTDPDGQRTGWQGTAGVLGDRDLKFFDAMLTSLIGEKRADGHRVYATGHSNGGGFTYLLWAERGDRLTAVAPSAAVMARGVAKLKAKPVLHLGSPSDPLVKFAWQARMIDRLLEINGCGSRKGDALGYTVYPSSRGAEVATYLHGNGHVFPEEGAKYVVQFFQAHAR